MGKEAARTVMYNWMKNVGALKTCPSIKLTLTQNTCLLDSLTESVLL